MCVHMHAYTCTHVQVWFAHVCACTHLHMCTWVHTCTPSHMHACAQVYTCMCGIVQRCTCTHVYTHMHLHMLTHGWHSSSDTLLARVHTGQSPGWMPRASPHPDPLCYQHKSPPSRVPIWVQGRLMTEHPPGPIALPGGSVGSIVGAPPKEGAPEVSDDRCRQRAPGRA